VAALKLISATQAEEAASQSAEQVSARLRARTSWIGVSFVPRLQKYRSFVFHPTLQKTCSCGSYGTAYEAARARHRFIRALDAAVAAKLSDDFVYDPMDPLHAAEQAEAADVGTDGGDGENVVSVGDGTTIA